MPIDKQEDVVVETRILLAQVAHGPLTLIRYDHGGGRLYREEPRDLIADFYDAANRELYYRAPELLKALADEVGRWKKQTESLVAAFDGDDYGDADVVRITRESALSVAKQELGWK